MKLSLRSIPQVSMTNAWTLSAMARKHGPDHRLRNFLGMVALQSALATLATASQAMVSALRSLPAPKGPDAIPRRISSSSLPPSFASGRFAGFSYMALRASEV